MNRREWCNAVALMAAGLAASQDQIAQFEKLFEVNTRGWDDSDIIDIKDIMFGFYGTPCDVSAKVTFWTKDAPMLQKVVNVRSFTRYVPSPDCPLLSTLQDFRWTIEDDHNHETQGMFKGTVRLVDMDMKIHNVQIDGKQLNLHGLT